jgi:hypothetical protein
MTRQRERTRSIQGVAVGIGAGMVSLALVLAVFAPPLAHGAATPAPPDEAPAAVQVQSLPPSEMDRSAAPASDPNPAPPAPADVGSPAQDFAPARRFWQRQLADVSQTTGFIVDRLRKPDSHIARPPKFDALCVLVPLMINFQLVDRRAPREKQFQTVDPSASILRGETWLRRHLISFPK